MKLRFFLMLVIGVTFSLASHAQISKKLPLTVGDTIVNTGTSSKVIRVTDGAAGIYVQVNLTKLSGTGAGTVQLQGSLDGTNYTNIGSAFTITNVASQSTLFSISAPVPEYVKVLSTGSGTESVVQTVYYRLPLYSRP